MSLLLANSTAAVTPNVQETDDVHAHRHALKRRWLSGMV
jgi:hypothetical protein